MKFKKARKKLLAMDEKDISVSAEEFRNNIIRLFAECGLYQDFAWTCHNSFMGMFDP